MRSPIVLGSIAALILIGAGIGFWLFSTHTPLIEEVLIPPADPRDSGATVLLTTRGGEVISVPDFTFNHPRVDLENTEITLVLVSQNADKTEMDPSYGIVYSTDSSFTIGLFSEPLGAARLRAEDRLRALVPVPDDILCQLPISVAVPDTIQPMYKGKDVGLSFCPGAVQLP